MGKSRLLGVLMLGLALPTSLAAQATITGRVVSGSGAPLQSASVFIQGLNVAQNVLELVVGLHLAFGEAPKHKRIVAVGAVPQADFKGGIAHGSLVYLELKIRADKYRFRTVLQAHLQCWVYWNRKGAYSVIT